MFSRTVSISGTTWTVWEVHPNAPAPSLLAPEFQRGWLCMRKETGERYRTAPIPVGWREWSDGRLGLAVRLAEKGRLAVGA